MICIPYDETISYSECRRWCDLTNCGLTTTCRGCSMGEQLKQCYRCGELKPLDQYTMDVKNKDNKRHVCKECDKARKRVRKPVKSINPIPTHTPEPKVALTSLLSAKDAKAIKLANQHWYYIEELLEAHGEGKETIKKIGFHYRSAFIHGHKHATEEAIA